MAASSRARSRAQLDRASASTGRRRRGERGGSAAAAPPDRFSFSCTARLGRRVSRASESSDGTSQKSRRAARPRARCRRQGGWASTSVVQVAYMKTRFSRVDQVEVERK